MAILQILQYPDPRLNKLAKRVDRFDVALEKLVIDMAETMYAAPGIGLAATQVNVLKRVVVIDTSEEKKDLLVLINPTVQEQDGEKENEEGCLSVPGIYEKVTRSETIKVRAQNLKGEEFEFEADGLLAVCVQHEIDHLNGKVFVEYLSNLKQTRIKTKLKKQRREVM